MARADDGGVYVGAQLYGAYRVSSGDSDVSGGVTVGYRFNEYFGVETSYKKTHLDSDLSSDDEGGIHGAELALRGSYPVSDWLGLTAKAGAYRWRASGSETGGADRGTDAIVGAGQGLADLSQWHPADELRVAHRTDLQHRGVEHSRGV